MPGMHGSKVANFTLQRSDLIISIGARFDDRVTGDTTKFAPDAKIIHIDIDPASISKIIAVDIPVVGDAKRVLKEMNKSVKGGDYSEWWKQVNDWKGDNMYPYKQSDKEIKPQYVLEELYKLTGGRDILATDVGQHQMWAAQYYKCDQPKKLLTSGGLGTMGFGLPAAMGASFGTDEIVWNVSGDGGIQMNIQELATIKIHNKPVKTLILNNEYLGMVRQWQDLFFEKRYSSTSLVEDKIYKDGVDKLGSVERGEYTPNFIKLTEAYGIPAKRVSKPSEVADALKWAKEIEGPCVIEFLVSQEENVFPMVPAGAALDEIIEAEV
jgi:acetolactate synthase-1/2/3 large subunit